MTRIISVFRVIEDLSARLGAITSRRTAVLWFGGGIPFNLGGTLPSWYRDAIRAAQRNNVAIYAIDPGGLGTKSLLDLAGLRVLAEDTYTRRNVPIDRVLLDTTIHDETSKVVLERSSAANTFPAGELSDRPFTLDVPLSQLVAGRYLLRVKAHVGGNERNASTREVTFWITD